MKGLGVTLRGAAEIAGAPLFPALELRLAPGEWTCLLGASGVGKSTILRLIAGLDTGARFDGDIVADDGAPLAGRVAYMAQDDLLFPWLSALENVALGARLRGARPDMDAARRMLGRVGLTAHADQRPAALSGGERQRVALARALMEARPVMLLDEPFSALDARTRAGMQEMAAEHLTGRTVLLVTHDPAEAARMGHRIAVLTPGGLIAADPPAAPPVRAVDDAEALARQGALHRLLMERA